MQSVVYWFPIHFVEERLDRIFCFWKKSLASWREASNEIDQSLQLILCTFAQTLLPHCHTLGWMLHTHQRGIKPTQPHYCPIKGDMLLCILSVAKLCGESRKGKHGMMPIKNEWKINHIPKIIITSMKKYYLIPLSPGNMVEIIIEVLTRAVQMSMWSSPRRN